MLLLKKSWVLLIFSHGFIWNKNLKVQNNMEAKIIVNKSKPEVKPVQVVDQELNGLFFIFF
jgi:hypothetical protein